MIHQTHRRYLLAVFIGCTALGPPLRAQINFQPVYDAMARDRADRNSRASDTAADRAEARAEAAENNRVSGYNNSLSAAAQALDNKDAASLEAVAREMLRLYPGDKVGLKYLGISVAMNGDFDAAENYYNQAKKAGMKNAQWRWLMANLNSLRGVRSLDRGDPQAAEAALRVALKYDDGADIWCNLGVAVDRQGRYDEALADYQRALKKSPNDQQYKENVKLVLAEQQQVKLQEEYRKTDHDVVAAAGQQLEGIFEASRKTTRGGTDALSLAGPDQAAAMAAWTDTSVVDLRGSSRSTPNSVRLAQPSANAATTSVAGFKTDLQLAPPPDPRVVPPIDHDLELLFPVSAQPQSLWPGPKRTVNNPRIIVPDSILNSPDKLASILPADSDILFLFPGETASMQNDLMFQGLLEMADKEKYPAAPAVNAVRTVPVKETPNKDPLSVEKSSGPKN